jgi:UDP-N-acetylmuramoyl-L-alanyl-D-glutamate--2,6-diaminopimelate ligase
MFSKENNLIQIDVLNKLLKQLNDVLKKCDLVIDSRKLDENSIFCAYKGNKLDGRDFIPEAIAKNVKYILWESGIEFPYNIPNTGVRDLLQYIGMLMSHKYDYPSKKLNIIGVTGTNGKTSISYWLHQTFNMLGNPSALIGTNGAGIRRSKLEDHSLTTPDVINMQKLLQHFTYNTIKTVALEVSSHSLVQGRVNGIQFSTAVFTNLTRDHLDYHGTMHEYYMAKRQLFFWHGLKHAIINIDDPYGLKLFNDLKANNPNLNIITYGIENGDLRATNIESTSTNLAFTLIYKEQSTRIETYLIGNFNILNLLAVISVLIVNNLDFNLIKHLIKEVKPVLGRMELIYNLGFPSVIVDFAHTPDALTKVLQSCRETLQSSRAKLYCVFGCGGERDVPKRAIMGEIASLYADEFVITSDNPRSENPEDIVANIVSGCKKQNFKIILDRAQAIAYCIYQMAKEGDIVLVLGKGHERFQIIGQDKLPWNDTAFVQKLLGVDCTMDELVFGKDKW